MFQSLQYDIAAVMQEAVASGLFVSVCDIEMPDPTLTDDGSPSGNYISVSGMTGIQCMNAPTSVARISAGEMKSQTEIESMNTGHVLLAGWYGILQTQTNWRAVVDGVAYDILGAESDSQMQMTRLKIQMAQV
jgi:hypothetical protein